MEEKDLCAQDQAHIEHIRARMRGICTTVLLVFLAVGIAATYATPPTVASQLAVLGVGAVLIHMFQFTLMAMTVKFRIWDIWNTTIGYTLEEQKQLIAKLQAENAMYQAAVERHKVELQEITDHALEGKAVIDAAMVQLHTLQQSTTIQAGQQGQTYSVTQQG